MVLISAIWWTAENVSCNSLPFLDLGKFAMQGDFLLEDIGIEWRIVDGNGRHGVAWRIRDDYDNTTF